MTKRNQTETALSRFVKQRLSEISDRKTRAEVAMAAGFENEATLAGIASGELRLPLDRTLALAGALEADRRVMADLALRQFDLGDLADVLSVGPELGAMRSDTNATLIAAQTEVAIIGAEAKAGATAALEVLKSATDISERQARLMRAMDELLVNNG